MAPTATPPPSALWFTSRSEVEDTNRCRRLGYLGWHYGPHGVGIRRRAQSVPLATGGSVHVGLAKVLTWVRDHDALPPADVVDAGVDAALTDYQALLDQRGLHYWEEGDEAYTRLVDEQTLLIEGLVRSWTLWSLPEILRTARVVHVEEEHVAVLGCTCGLGDRVGSQADHDHRECEGIGLQCRADFVAQQRTSGLYQYHEFKTAAEASKRKLEEFDTGMQPYIGTAGLEAALGIQVEEIYIHLLLKGKRSKEYVEGRGYEGPEYQDSRLVSAYYNTEKPEAQEWAVRYEWWEDKGDGWSRTKRRLPKAFKKTSLRHFLSQPGAHYEDYLVGLADELRPLVLYTHGPLLRKDAVREAALAGIYHDAQRNRAIIWELQEVLEAAEGRLDAPAVQEALDRLAPCSFQCQPFGSKYACAMIPLCHRHPGWESPELLGFMPRRPHHQPELDQLRARGFEPAAFAEEVTGED
jgi:hypothetical protein